MAEEDANSKEVLFEKHHKELVEEAGELASTCSADVTTLAFSPCTGKAYVHHFGAAGMGKEKLQKQKKGPSELMRFVSTDVEAMGLAEVQAFEQQVLAIRASTLRRLQQLEAQTKRP